MGDINKPLTVKNKMFQRILLAAACSILLVLNSCKNKITEPEDKPGSRNYTWTIDTIKTATDGGYVSFHKMWGSAPENIWAVGASDVSYNSTWFYNGKQWKKDSLQRMGDSNALFGFSKNDIWRVSMNNEFWHYDGSGWKRHSTYSYKDYSWIAIEDMWGTNPNDIYSVGVAGYPEGVTGEKYEGIILHYNNSKWEFLKIPEIKVSFTGIRKQDKTGLFFLDGWTYDPKIGETYKLFTFDGKELNEIYSGSKSTQTQVCKGEVYIVMDRKIHKYINGRLEVWKDLSNTEMAGSLIMRNEKDFFCISFGGLGHYNGTDYQTVLRFNPWLSGGVVFEKDVYFIAEDIYNGIDIFIHGKLNE